MIELKAIHAFDVYEAYTKTGDDEAAQVYLKSEADKVIAELKDKLKVQTSIAEEGWRESGTYHTSYAKAVKELYEKNKELRHHKYKRCLAMAKWCQWKMGVFIYKKEKNEFYYRWHKRWLELAYKFKESK